MPSTETVTPLVYRLAWLLERRGELDRAGWLRAQTLELEHGEADRAERKLGVELTGGSGSILDLALDDEEANELKWELVDEITRHLDAPIGASPN